MSLDRKTGWRWKREGTPDGRGMLPTAQAEIAAAQRRAELAPATPINLDRLRRHHGNVGHRPIAREDKILSDAKLVEL